MKDIDGDLVSLLASDTIVVESGIFEGTYTIMGYPEPIRKKRKQIMWVLALKQDTGKNSEAI
jgi:hypothetical protein